MSDSRNEVRTTVREWLGTAWSADHSLWEWRCLLADAGWAAPCWPKEWFGRSLPSWAEEVVAEEFGRISAVGPPPGAGMSLAAPTLLHHGDDNLKERFLRPILTGEESWCQLFSEPGAGSDLAGVATRAERDGDEWIVSGQKLWSTSAHHADFGLLLARTNWDVPKHRGLTYFVLPMRQDSIEVRPLRQMNGHSSFNEIFLTDARVPSENIVGETGGGWKVALTTLEYERQAARHDGVRVTVAGESRAAQEAEKEEHEYQQTYSWYPQRSGRADLAVPYARSAGKGDDPVIRDQIASLVTLVRVSEWTSQRARSAIEVGRNPGAAGSLGKVAGSNIARAAADVHSSISGASAMLSGSDGPLDGVIAEILLSVPAKAIAGGTDEIQKNILAERILGLPREPSLDKDIPFRKVPRSGIDRSA